MQVYQAVRLALDAASLGQEYVRSAVDYVRRRGEKAESSPQPAWTKLSEQAEATLPVQTAPGSVAVYFVSALRQLNCQSSGYLTSRAWPSEFPSHQPRNLIAAGNTPRRRF